MKYILVILVAIGLSTSSGCGGSSSPSAPPPGPPARKPKVALKEEAPVAIIHVPNKKWDRIKDAFEKFANEPATAKKDTYRDNIVNFVAKPEIPEVPEEEAPIEEPLDSANSPLQRYTTDEFRLLMVMSGTVIPKAVVVDPIGNTWVVKKDTPIGNKNGVIQNITQYSVIVREPDGEKPIEKTIKPEIFTLAEDLSASTDQVSGAERLSVSPVR